jgi:DNA-directed RNA polymerase
MTVLQCKDKGLTDIMVVHDSFATNIADTRTLSLATRQQFIDLYHDYCLFEDILAQARETHSDPDNTALQGQINDLFDAMTKETNEETIQKMATEIEALKKRLVVWPTIPDKGDKGMFLDLGEVMASDYFFN